MGNATLRYRPLEGEPAYSRRRPPALSLPLAAARLVAKGCVALARLAVTALLALAIAAVLLVAGLRIAGGRIPAVGDANDYLSSVLRVSAGWLDSDPQLPDGAAGLISETSSTSVERPTPSPGSAANLVATLSQLAPSDLRQVYQQAVPMLQQYDAFLGDVQSALAKDRDLDAFFADLEPWLQQAEAESQNQ
jgi:hypothetical protein